jgi:glycosyltransferase involved in cell wall biosynthesis
MSKVISLFLAKLDGSGVPRAMVNLAGGFQDAGYRVDLVLANAVGAFREEVPRGVRVLDLGVPRVLRAFPGLVRYLDESRPDAMVSAEDHANLVALLARRLSRSTRTRVAVTGHVLFSRRLGASVWDRGYWVLKGIKWLYPWADCVSTVSAGLADDMAASLNYPRNKITVIHNPVVTPAIFERAHGEIPHPWLRDGQGPVAIGVGRLSYAKNFEVLLKAIAKLGEVRCLIIGEGDRRSMLEAMVCELGLASRVKLMGFQPNPFPWMAHADALVLSSRFEGLPTVLIEAMALGCPVVATDCPHGPREILQDGELGPLVPVDDVTALAEGIRRAIAHPVSKARLTARAADFHVERITHAYLEALGLQPA